MWIKRIHPHIRDEVQRLTPDLRLLAIYEHFLTCGKILDNLPTKITLIFPLFTSLPYIGFSKKHPPYMGVSILKLGGEFSTK